MCDVPTGGSLVEDRLVWYYDESRGSSACHLASCNLVGFCEL